MPQEHSPLYLREGLIRNEGAEKRLDPTRLTAWMSEQALPGYNGGSSFYDQMSDLLRETNDSQFNIVSKLVGDSWVRDATAAIPLDGRMAHDAPVIEANNALLRCLSRLRAIDYAIAKKLRSEGNEIRTTLKEQFSTLTRKILEAAQATPPKLNEIKALEKEFNTSLIKSLHAADLTRGCTTTKDAEKLLFHYRNLSSLITPARTMVTLTYDETARALQRETQYPVTSKTDAQREAIEKLRDIHPYPLKDEKSAHSVRDLATQEADSLFVDLMRLDDRALPAQARKTHLAGAKNAFIVKNELVFAEEGESLRDILGRAANEKNTLWLARSGAPVYIGKGEKDASIQTHTIENLEQIRRAAAARMGAAERAIHVTSLNTDTPLENQGTIVRHLYDATRKKKRGDDISYMPTNSDGTFRLLDVAPSLTFVDGTRPWGSAPLQKATRLDGVASVMLRAADEGKLSLVQCASGQDRTGTAVEIATQKWMAERYRERDLEEHIDHIEHLRAAGGNAAEIASHHVPGSPGMKADSRADNIFDGRSAFTELATREFYRSSAATNKKNAVGNVAILKSISDRAWADYARNLAAFEAALNLYQPSRDEEKDETKEKLYEAGRSLLNLVKAIEMDKTKPLNAKSLSDLNLVLVHGAKALTEPRDEANIRKLAGLSQTVSGRASPNWKKLGTALLVLGCAALVVVGILAIPATGGLSLLASGLGAAGLAALVGGSAVAAGAGLALNRANREKGLAKNITLFREALEHIREEDISSPAPSSSDSDEGDSGPLIPGR